jgi:hypothetical protein
MTTVGFFRDLFSLSGFGFVESSKNQENTG